MLAINIDIKGNNVQSNLHDSQYNWLTSYLRTFAPKSSYGEIFFISPLELVDKVLTPKMKKKMGVTDFVSEKMAVEKCLNFDKSVIITRCSLLC